MKNKLTNASEVFGMNKKTPMAIFLNEFGLEADLKYIN